MNDAVNQQAAAQTATQATTALRQAALFGRLTIAGLALYLILDIIAQLLPPHYSPIAQAESDLAVGPYGFVMTINFVVRGLLSLALLLGLSRGIAPAGRSRLGMALLAAWAAGAFLLAIFPTNLAGQRLTTHGAIHLIVAALAFIFVAVGELLIARRFDLDPRWRTLRMPALTLASLTLLALVIELVMFRSVALFGLFERLFLALALLWMLVVALRLSALGGQPSDAAATRPAPQG